MVNIELKGPAVFIGRCSTVILGESPRVLKSFIYSSDTEKRVERIIRTENVSETDAKYLMQKRIGIGKTISASGHRRSGQIRAITIFC